MTSSAEGLDLSKSLPFLRCVAEFLNWAPAEGWTKQGRSTGPGGYLLWALLYMSGVYFLTALPLFRIVPIEFTGVYFLTALPLFRIVPIEFIATDPGGWAFWLIGLAALVLFALVLGTIAAAVVWWRHRGRDVSPRDGQPPRQAAPRTSRWRRPAAWLVLHGGAAFAAFLIIVGAAVALAAFLYVGAYFVAVVVALAGGVMGGNKPPKGDLTTDRIDAILALYRANACRAASRPSSRSSSWGSPGSAGSSPASIAATCRSRPRRRGRTWTGHRGHPSCSTRRPCWRSSGIGPSSSAMSSPWRELLGRRPIVLALVLAFDAFILAGPLFRPRELRSVDGVWFVWCLTALFTLVFVRLTFHGLQLVLLWRRMRRCCGGSPGSPWSGRWTGSRRGRPAGCTRSPNRGAGGSRWSGGRPGP